MALGEYIGAGSGTTKLLLHLNGNSTDSSGNGNNGTDTAITYSLANGKLGQGAGFNGSSSFIDLQQYTNIIPSGATEWTISMWFYVNSWSTDTYATGFYYENTNGASLNTKYSLRRDTTTGKIVSSYRNTDAGAAIDLGSSNTSPSTGVWINIIHTVNTNSGVSNFFINGNLDKTNSFTAGSAIGPSAANKQKNIGAIQRTVTNYQGFINGNIDEVIIENVAWSAEKVKKEYTYQKGRFGIV